MSETISKAASPDAPTTTNKRGGNQSDIGVRFDLIDAKALFEMAKVLDHGAKKYGEGNWRLIPVQEHLNHLLMHTYAYLAGDDSDDHLSHILCRATFALGVALQGPQTKPNLKPGFYCSCRTADANNSNLQHEDHCQLSPNFNKEIAY